MGTASWTDRTLIESGLVPAGGETRRSSGCGTTPGSSAWSRWTPPITRCPPSGPPRPGPSGPRPGSPSTSRRSACSPSTRPGSRALPADLRPAAEQPGKDRVYPKDLDPRGHRARSGSGSCPRWSRCARPASWGDAAPVPALVPHLPRAARSTSWPVPSRPRPAGVRGVPQPHLDDGGQPGRDARLPGPSPAAVRVRGHAAGPPDLHPAGARRHRPELAVVRLHGHSDKWDSTDIHERFGYRYTDAELRTGPGGRGLAGDA